MSSLLELAVFNDAFTTLRVHVLTGLAYSALFAAVTVGYIHLIDKALYKAGHLKTILCSTKDRFEEVAFMDAFLNMEAESSRTPTETTFAPKALAWFSRNQKGVYMASWALYILLFIAMFAVALVPLVVAVAIINAIYQVVVLWLTVLKFQESRRRLRQAQGSANAAKLRIVVAQEVVAGAPTCEESGA
ncbi:hypothetical protein HDU82_004886 [Entophlyctis luteolus]|nr:hypothetical protein HDU82_004886 [Entophlyctis luteolus]